MINGINDELILAARLLLATLFLIFGWRKVRDYSVRFRRQSGHDLRMARCLLVTRSGHLLANKSV